MLSPTSSYPNGGVIVRRFTLLSTLAALVVAWAASAADDTPKAAETRKRLQQKITCEYVDTPLKEVVEDLKSQVKGLGIRIDTAGGVSMNTKVTYKAEGKTLAEVLDEIGTKHGWGYIVINKEGDAYDGSLRIKQGKERGYAAGEEKTAAKAPAKEKEKEKVAEKPAPAKEKPAETEKPADDADKAEMLAASRLKLAKQIQADGKLDRARERYESIVKDYPKTKAADEARELLKKLKK